MTPPIYLQSFAALNSTGIISPARTIRWDADQQGPADVKRQQVLGVPYPTFGKLSLADRLAFATSSLLLAHQPITNGTRTALCAGVPYGSLGVDLAFVESLTGQFPSPAIFSATLPSSPLSEIAICYKIKGPNRVFCNANRSGIWALGYAGELLYAGKAGDAIVLYVKCLEAADGARRFANATELGNCACYALHFSTNRSLDNGLALPCRFSWQPGASTAHDESDELLFKELFSAIVEQRSFNSTLDPYGLHGNLSIETGM